MSTIRNKDKWDSLSMKEKSDMMKVAVQQGIYNLSDIRKAYNEYAEGGPENQPYTSFLNDTPMQAAAKQLQADYASNLYDNNEGASIVLTPWKALDNIDYVAIPDITFTKDKTGVGDIEYFSAEHPEGITYSNGYYKKHPKPGKDVILYNPITNGKQDIRLDALHIMPKDATYDVLNTMYRNAAKDGDVSYNANKRRNEDIKKYGEDKVDSFKQYFNNEADGFLRNMFIEGTPEYIESRKYYPDKQQLREWNKHLMPYTDAIQQYLETGERPPYVLPEVTITPDKKSLGGPLIDLSNQYAEGGDTNEYNNIIDWIINEEGFNSKPENIGDGKITLGSGLTNPKWLKMYEEKGVWTPEDNRTAVTEEVENRRKWSEENVPNWIELPTDSQNALLSYKYNYDFTPKNSPLMFQALRDKNWEEAARQINATSSNPKFKKGLQARRQREQEMFMRGIDSMNAPEPEVVEEVPQEESIYTPPQRVLDNMAAHNGRYMIMGNPPFAGVRNTVLDALRRLKALNLFVEGGPLVETANRTL